MSPELWLTYPYAFSTSMKRGSVMARKRVGNKRERIIAAAAKLFGDKDYHDTTTAKIAESAGVAAGTIYIYFSSKEELLVAVFEEFLGRHMDRLREGVEREKTPREKLVRLLTLGLELMQDNPDSARIFLSQLRQSTKMITTVVKRSSRVYKDIIEDVLIECARSGVCRNANVHATASMLFGAFQSTVLDWVADECSYTLTDMTEELTEFVLYGMCCDRPEEEGAAQ
ncbi:MAG: TetR/AcrR family transcriptional regulator [Candidatus Eisenbacteria sp.]|nr:TetR/AcrR family transcriptional regulator [Candidatus Eisenbacteria bacterium]